MRKHFWIASSESLDKNMRFLELLCYVISMLLFLGFAEAGLSDEKKEGIVHAHNFY